MRDDGGALPGAADVPSLGDFVPGFEAGSWWASALRKHARAIIDAQPPFNAALADPGIRTRLTELGRRPSYTVRQSSGRSWSGNREMGKGDQDFRRHGQ